MRKILGICGPHGPNVGAKWSILVDLGGRRWSSWRRAQRELDTNLPIQARTAAENKQITNNYLKFGSSWWSASRTYILGPDMSYTYRINLGGVAPTSLPTFVYLDFCLHWVKLSPRNCMDLHTRGWHGIYQMCRIMNRSLHFNRGNARDALARMGAGYLVSAMHNSASLEGVVGSTADCRGWVEARLAIES